MTAVVASIPPLLLFVLVGGSLYPLSRPVFVHIKLIGCVPSLNRSLTQCVCTHVVFPFSFGSLGPFPPFGCCLVLVGLFSFLFLSFVSCPPFLFLCRLRPFRARLLSRYRSVARAVGLCKLSLVFVSWEGLTLMWMFPSVVWVFPKRTSSITPRTLVLVFGFFPQGPFNQVPKVPKCQIPISKVPMCQFKCNRNSIQVRSPVREG